LRKNDVIKDNQALFYGQFAEFADVETRDILLYNGVTLHSASFYPKDNKGYPPVIFVPGFASVMESFTGILISLASEFTVHYIETRDKASSVVPGNLSFNVRDIASDISCAADKLDMPAGEYILLTYSLGATAAAESFNSIIIRKPALLVLVEPSGVFKIPPWSLFVARWFGWTYSLIKPLILLYIRTFMINIKEDEEMYRIVDRALNAADSGKLIKTYLGISGYKIWDVLPMVDVPTIVIGASSDTFHSLGDAMEISKHINKADYIDLVTNMRSHSPEVTECVKTSLGINTAKDDQ
jgi:hypothetical protein